jgi:hypothetical protein
MIVGRGVVIVVVLAVTLAVTVSVSVRMVVRVLVAFRVIVVGISFITVSMTYI